MSNKNTRDKKIPKKGIVYRLGHAFIERKTRKIDTSDNGAYLQTEEQRKLIKRIKIETYTLSALIGVVAVLLLIIPYHLFPLTFKAEKFNVFGNTFEFEMLFTIFGVLMLFPEIWALNYVNLRAVRRICQICNFPSNNNKLYQEQVNLLTESGLEMPAKHLEVFKINPYIGLSKFEYYSFFIFNKLKATLSNLVAKILIKRFLGRYALRVVTDLAGIPIFAFWNAWASSKVIQETQMRIISSAATDAFLATISKEELLSVTPNLKYILHFIAQQKREYNFALYAYIKGIIEQIPDLDLTLNEEVKLNYFSQNISNENSKVVSKLIAFGLIVDGHISIKEKFTINKLKDQKWFAYKSEQLNDMLNNYIAGKGLIGF